MKLSENQNYMDHAKARAFGDLGESERFLKACIAEADSRHDRAFLFTRMGNLVFEQGRKEESLKWYKDAEDVDKTWLMPVLFFAEFLAYRLGDTDASLKKCDDIIKEVKEHPFDETDELKGGDYYERKALEIREFCLSRGARP